MVFDAEKIRAQFPIFERRKQRFIYFDNACTTLKPRSVIEAQNEYYAAYSACAGRSVHSLSKQTEEAFEGSRKKIAVFFGADSGEVVWTRNATEALNLVALSLDFSRKNKVVTSNMEHHSALLPFQRLALNKKIKLDFVYADKATGEFAAQSWLEKIDKHTCLVVTQHTSNVLGTQPPLREIVRAAHDNGALVLVDAAQGAPHHAIDFRKEGFDFMAVSGHKMCGPTGIGCLIGKQSLLKEMPPFMLGGETIESATLENCVFKKPPKKFEAGIQNYAGAIGFAAATEFLRGVGMRAVEEHERKLAKTLFEELSRIKNVKIFGPSDVDAWKRKCGIVTFNVANAAPHEIALMLDNLAGVCVRSGVFCAEPAMNALGAPRGAVRASLYLYNTDEEVRVFAETLKKIAAAY
ncbi:MAG: cysteine desulfurase [Candidatus Micrarchaeota archaeon]